MKKRIACLLLALVMLVGLIPVTAIPAKAASFAYSEAGLRVIKENVGFHKNAYKVGDKYLIGYGTAGAEGQTITEANADRLLRESLNGIAGSLSAAFPSSLGLVPKRMDALIWFSFMEGTGWAVSGNKLYDAVVSGVEDSAFVDAMCTWDFGSSLSAVSDAHLALVQRRLCMVNMYLNGSYSASNTGSFSYSVYDAGEGATINGNRYSIQAYNVFETAKPNKTPVMSGASFLGWYLDGSAISGLSGVTAGKTLTAKWQKDSNAVGAGYTLAADVIYKAHQNGSGADPIEIYIYEYPTESSTKLDILNRQSVITVANEVMVGDVKWLQLSTTGWVKLGKLENVPGAVPSGVVTITDDYVNVRESPSATAAKLGTIKRGEQRTITMISNDGKWGYCSQGWIFLAYTDYVANTSPNTSNGSTPTVSSGTPGTVTGAVRVNVRTGPGVGNALATTLAEGTAVTVYEQTTADGAPWGRIDQGWISLGYVKLQQVQKPADSTSITVGSSAVVSSSVRLNVRSGPGTTYSKVASLAPGTSVVILRKQTVGGATWGLIDQGWINLSYVSTAGISSEGGSVYSVGGTVVNCSTGVNIRAGAGTTNALIGVAGVGTRVNVTEIVEVNGFKWGHIERGWVCMDYVQLDSEFKMPEPTVPNVVEDAPDNVVTSFEGYPATVTNIEGANLYESATIHSNALLKLRTGAEVNIMAWYKTSANTLYGKVAVGDKTGWVALKDLTMNTFNAKVTATKVDVYEEPSTRSKFFAALVNGTYVTVEQTVNNANWRISDSALWGKIQSTGSVPSGWIQLKNVTMFRDNMMPTGITTLSGVGYLTGTMNVNSTIIKDTNSNVTFTTDGSGTIVPDYTGYTLTAGTRVNIQARNYLTDTTNPYRGTTYAKVTVGSLTGWIPVTDVTMDTVALKTNGTVKYYANLVDVAADAPSGVLPAGARITVGNRELVLVPNEINHGVIDAGFGFVEDNPAACAFFVMDNGTLSYVTDATVEDPSNPVIASSVVLTGKAVGDVYIREDTIDSTDPGMVNLLLKVSNGSPITVLNWKYVDGITWGKVQINKVVGWVKASEVNFSGLKGQIAVDELKLYNAPDTTSAVQILRVNGKPVEIVTNDISLTGNILWGKVVIDGTHNGWIDLSQITTNTPGIDVDPDPTALPVMAKAKINSVNVTIGTVEGQVEVLPKGTEVNLIELRMNSANKAEWKIDLGNKDSWVDMDCLNMYSAVATITESSAPIYDDLTLNKTLYTLYRDEKVTVQSFRISDLGHPGVYRLYGEVAYGNTTGWILLCREYNADPNLCGHGSHYSGNLPVRLVPGSTGSIIGGGNGGSTTTPTTPTTPTEPTTPAAEPIAAYIVCNTTVNVRSGAGVSNSLVTTLPNGTNVKIYEKAVELGKEWARIDQGWVCMDYVRLGTLTNVPNGGNNGNSGSVTIITTVPAGAIAVGYANEDIKIRSGSGLGYPEVATLKKGQSIAIYENKLDGGMSWGRTDNGWVCTSYLTITGIGVSGSGSMGTIARCGFTANVRGSASSNGALMAKVMISSRVAVHETTTVGAETWARTDLGWISTQYIVMDTETAPAPTVPDATTPTTPSAPIETTPVGEEGGEYVG